MFLALLLAFAVTVLVLWFLLRHRIARLIVDHPNERSLHQLPTPRIGGIALMAGIAAGWSALAAPPPWPLVTSLGVLVALSLLDDWRGLPVALRFVAQALIVIGYLLLGAPELQPITLLPGAWLAMLWMVNLYNFMDGSDGLAGGMAVFGFGTYACAAWLMGNPALMSLSACVAAAAAGFLWFNFHPAKVFMGDAGSIPLGFLAAALGLMGIVQGSWPVWFPVVVFAPFVTDATVTLFRRLSRGEKVWRAHRTHYYQRLVQSGWGHRGVALGEYGLMGLTGLAAVWAIKQPPTLQGATLGALGGIYVMLMIWVDRKWARHMKTKASAAACE
jgi:UDP-GlcNAc:undecaprenyl-phosphate/decaprenyl-phosphate GlcNAc-1-phosphate transferase